MIARGRDIACTRGGRQLYRDLSFSLMAGESLQVVGPNGTGKSSLLRQVCGLIPCNYGEILLGSRLALADENCALDDSKTLGGALSFWAQMDSATPAGTAEAMERMALTTLRELPVRMLSTGQRKRATLARAIASGATLWLLDEPGNGLDEASLAALGEAMDAHIAQGGAIIAASHFDLPHRFTHRLNLTDYAP